MTAQVVFLPGWRQVSDEEMQRRLRIQEELHYANIEFYQSYRYLPFYEYAIRKEEVHLRARQLMGVVRTIENNR